MRMKFLKNMSFICRFTVSLVAAALFVLPGGDLLAKGKSRTPVTSIIKGLEMSPQELRVRIRALVRPTLGIIEENADMIIANTSDPVVRRGAITLKIEMTTTILAAMFRDDPVLALADSWGYVLQVRNALAQPWFETRYGQSARKASEALALVENQFRDFVANVQGGRFAESFASTVRKWADDHPIEGSLYRRPSIDSAAAELLASSGASGVFAALGNLDETMADVMARMDLYTMYLPRLARWEAELMADDLTRGVDPRTLSIEFARMARAVDRIASVAETASDLAARERKAALEAVRKERIATLHEAEAVIQRVADRAAAPLHDAVRADLAEVMNRIEEMRSRLIVDAGETLKQVVDHAFIRLVQLVLICAVLAVLVLVLRSVLLRQRGRQHDVPR